MFIQPLKKDLPDLNLGFMSAIVVAIDANNAIGNQNNLLCQLPKDMKYFKRLTEGNVVVMGRNTYESLPIKPLVNSENIVITKDFYPKNFPGCVISSNLDWVWQHAKFYNQKLFFIGGAKLYASVIGRVDRLFVTKIHHEFDHADIFFPDIDPDYWELISQEDYPQDDLHPYAFSFLVYQKKSKDLD